MNRLRLSSFLPHVLLHRLAFLLSIIWHCDDELFLGLERDLTGFDDILQMRVCCILTVVTFLLVSRFEFPVPNIVSLTMMLLSCVES